MAVAAVVRHSLFPEGAGMKDHTDARKSQADIRGHRKGRQPLEGIPADLSISDLAASGRIAGLHSAIGNRAHARLISGQAVSPEIRMKPG